MLNEMGNTTHDHKWLSFDPLTLALCLRERGSKEAIYDRGQYSYE
jgi:hypothetical protein